MLKTSKTRKVRVKLREMYENLIIFNSKERANYEIYEEGGKVRVKIVREIGKSEEYLNNWVKRKVK